MVDGGVAVRVMSGVAGPTIRFGKKAWNNRQSQAEFDLVLRQALARAISAEHFGMKRVQEAAVMLAKRFATTPRPGAASDAWGRVTLWTRSKWWLGLDRDVPNASSVHPGGGLAEFRRWADNALAGPDVAAELEAVSKLIKQRVDVDDVVGRFPHAFEKVVQEGPINRTKETLAAGFAAGELGRGLLGPKRRPGVVLGASAAVGAISAAAGDQVGLDYRIAVMVGLGVALVTGVAMVLTARFPPQREAVLAVRIAAVRWAADFFNTLGPADMRGVQIDAIEHALHEAIARSQTSPSRAGVDERRMAAAGTLVDDLSSRLIRRAETVADSSLVAALYSVEDHSVRVLRGTEDAGSGTLYNALLGLVQVCSPPLSPSTFSRDSRNLVHLLALVASSLAMPSHSNGSVKSIAVGRTIEPAFSGQSEPAAASGNDHTSTSKPNLPSIRLEIRLTQIGRLAWPSLPVGGVPVPYELTNHKVFPNWRLQTAFPHSCLSNTHYFTHLRNSDVTLESKVRPDESRKLTVLLRRGGGTVTVDGLCTNGEVDLERLMADLISSVQILVLHAQYRALRKGKASFATELHCEPSKEGSTPYAVQVGRGDTPAVTVSLQSANLTSATEPLGVRATGKSMAKQLSASRRLFLGLLNQLKVEDPKLLVEDPGTTDAPETLVVARAWRTERQPEIEAWSELHNLPHDLPPARISEE